MYRPDWDILVERGQNNTIVTITDLTGRTSKTVTHYAFRSIRVVLDEVSKRLELRESVNRA